MASHGTAGMLLETISEQLWFVANNCEIGCRQADLGDTVGLVYSVRRIFASVNVIVATTADLVEQFPPLESRPEKAWTTEDKP